MLGQSPKDQALTFQPVSSKLPPTSVSLTPRPRLRQDAPRPRGTVSDSVFLWTPLWRASSSSGSHPGHSLALTPAPSSPHTLPSPDVLMAGIVTWVKMSTLLELSV